MFGILTQSAQGASVEDVNQKVFNRRIEKERYAAEPQAQDPDSEKKARPRGYKPDQKLSLSRKVSVMTLEMKSVFSNKK